jgi:haloacetate dehalogenase
MDGFKSTVIETGETSIFLRSGGAGPPLLLLHGFPETHLMWRSVAPLLARGFHRHMRRSSRLRKKRMPDLFVGPRSVRQAGHSARHGRGNGRSRVSALLRRRTRSRRPRRLSHGTGSSQAYRKGCCPRYPPGGDRVGACRPEVRPRLRARHWPWSLLAQPHPLPETILVAAAESIVDSALGGWGSPV